MMTESSDHQPTESSIPEPILVKKRSTALLITKIVVGIAVVAFIGLFPLVQSAHEAVRRAGCMSHLKMIGLALHNYHDTYGSFPPAYIADAQGRPMHSWRVLLLPKLDEKALYDQYRFDEPWNGPNNIKLAETPLPIFQCPSDKDVLPNETSYLAVVGPNTAWPGSKSVSFRDIKDGSSNTLLVVEVAGSGINWMEPRDLSVIQMPMVFNSPKNLGISSKHDEGAQAVFCDGRVKFLSNDLSPEMIRRLLEINDGEKLGEY